VRLLARLGRSTFIPIHIKPHRTQFPSHDKNWVEALKLFLEVYAFERAGAPQAYRKGASRALENCKDSLKAPAASQKVWNEFLRILGGMSPNPKLNPLIPNPTRPYDALAFCEKCIRSGDKNVYAFSIRELRSNNVRAAHDALCQIRGIGPKIASLFLRDIALDNGIVDINLRDRLLLQPIDIWLQRSTRILTGRKDLTSRQAAQQLVGLADEANCCALCLNAGSWYFGSQVMQTEEMLQQSLKDPESLISALERHRKDLKEQHF